MGGATCGHASLKESRRTRFGGIWFCKKSTENTSQRRINANAKVECRMKKPGVSI